MSGRRTRAFATALLLGVAAMAHAGESTGRAALEAAARAWVEAFNAGDAGKLSALVTDDVVLLDPDAAPVAGREKVLEAWQQSMSRGGVQLTMEIKEAVIAGDFAWTIVAWSQKTPAGPVASRGQSLEIWKRIDGAWKLHRQMAPTAFARPRLRPRPVPSEPVLDERTD